MKLFAARTLVWSALVALYAMSPLAGMVALAAGVGFVFRGYCSPVQ